MNQLMQLLLPPIKESDLTHFLSPKNPTPKMEIAILKKTSLLRVSILSTQTEEVTAYFQSLILQSEIRLRKLHFTMLRNQGAQI